MVSVKLIVRGGVNAGREIRLPGPKFLVGRADDCHLRPNSDLVSRHHCVVLVEDDFVSVRDFGSKNGTQVDNERVVGERELTNGCHLKIGPLEFDVQIAQAAEAKKKRPKVQSIKEAATRSAEGLSEADDVDISNWIDDGGETQPQARPAPISTDETQTIHDGGTEEINLGQTLMGGPGDSKTKAVSPDQPTREMQREKDQPKKTPGKLPPLPKSGMGDSGSAAADTLRKLFNRR